MDLSVGRLLTLLELLQAYRRLSAAEIADRLEVSPRTVRRYVTGLQDMGIPVEAERGRAGGYRLRPGFRLPPLMFTNDEALVVVVGLLAAQRLGLATGPAAEGVLAKLDRVLPETLRRRVQATQEMVGLGLTPIARGHADAETVLTLTSAARDGNRVQLTYRSSAGDVTERRVDPYGVGFQNGYWYLVAWDHLREDMRSFRLDRMIGAEPTRETFTRPRGFDLVGHLQRMLAAVPWGWRCRVLLDLPLEQARARVPASVGIVEEAESGVTLDFGAESLGWAARFLAGLDCDLTVLEPAELGEAISAMGRRLIAAAGGRQGGVTRYAAGHE